MLERMDGIFINLYYYSTCCIIIRLIYSKLPDWLISINLTKKKMKHSIHLHVT